MEAEKRLREEWPLSFTQERIWFLNQLLPGCPVYHIPAAWRLRGPLDLLTLKQSLAALTERHAMLSTIFALVDGHPVQKRAQGAAPPLIIEDLRGLPLAQQDAALGERLQAATRLPFDFSQGPVWRAAVFQLADEEYVLLVIFHEMIADDESVNVFERDLGILYSAFAHKGTILPSLPELPLHYADVAQRQQLQDEESAALLAYWRQQLEAAPTVLELPGDAARPATQTFWSASHTFTLPGSLFQDIQLLSQQANAAPFMTLLAAFQVLLFRYTEQETLLVGTPTPGRKTEAEGIIGPLANTLVLQADLSGNPSFRELLARVRRTCVEALAHQAVSFARLVEAIQLERDLSRNPLVQVMFAFQAASQRLSPIQHMGAIEMLPVSVERGMTTADLSITLREEADELVGTIEYSRDLFREETIIRLAEHYRTLLNSIAANPSRRISDLPMLTEAERQQLLVEWNQTQAAYPTTLLHRLFEAQVEQTPDAAALVCAGEQLTYDALNRSANQIAHLLRSLGVGPEIPVGVLLERSPDLIIGLLGVLKAGGAYVPLDPTYPQERLAFTIQNAQAPVLLTQQQLLSCLSEQARQRCTVICLDTGRADIAGQSQENIQSDAAPMNLAYIIYTSGSTGQPKGVGIAHQSAVILLHWARELYSPEDLAGMFASTSVCFDLSVFELFVPLSWGGRVLLAENALRLPEIARMEQVTLVNTVPSAMAELVRNGQLPDTVQTVNLAGEALPRQLVEQIYAFPTVRRVLNLYGPTEDTTYSTWALLEREDERPVPIGRPLPTSYVYLLDRQMQPVPVGVPGELYLGGSGLARGYIHRQDLTAERFVPDPLSSIPGSRLYRTGDLARYRANGDIEYLGRIDHQVKLRGFRIELGEIEACLKRHPLVQEAVVILRRDHAEQARLVAYVVPEQEGSITSDDLERALLKDVPSYMMPAAFVLLAALPLSPNGKIDRWALPAPEVQREQVYVAPRNPTEELVAQAWMDVLDLTHVSIYENFFKLGGHSLLVMRVLVRLQKIFQIEIPLQRFFEGPTIASLSEALEEMILAEITDISDEEVEQELNKLAWGKRTT